ncbi:MAG: WecB/TagA/CpsF family glycosyltransferase [Methylophaga sp.]|nr:WecB/TagA/CpsF family glycosyltransferase [Methylophaga sp.]
MDFMLRTKPRASGWIRKIGMEWYYRLFLEPRRRWRRYVIGNVYFLWRMIHEKA